MLFATALLAIGLIHFIFKTFPAGLLPVPATVPGKTLLIYISGTALIITAILLFLDKLSIYGAYLAAAIWLVMIALVQLPQLVQHLHNPGPWTTTFENISLFGGACMLTGKFQRDGKYLFASALIVFGVQHYLYTQFITTLIPTWLVFHLFWAWVVTIPFFASAISILIGKKARLAGMLLATMFLIWVIILHFPRAIANGHSEPEWTSMFVATAAGAVALLVAGLAKD